MPRFGLQSLPRVDPLEILRRTGTGVADQTGVSQLVQGMMPGGGLNTFARQLAGGHPGAAWDTYAHWRGPLNAGGEMQLPWGPGIAHVPGTRTPPARPLAQTMANRDLSRFVSQTQRGIDRAPTLNPLSAFAQTQINEIQMGRIGMSKEAIQARLEQERLRKQVRRGQDNDQIDAATAHLATLFPEAGIMPHIPQVNQNVMRRTLLGARDDTNAAMMRAPIFPGNQRVPGQFKIPEGTAVPQQLERVRNQMGGLMDYAARMERDAGVKQQIRDAADRLRKNVPGAHLEPLWNAPVYRGQR